MVKIPDHLPPLSSLPPQYVTADISSTLSSIAITFTVLDTVFVVLRFLSKYLGSNPFGLDDVLIVLAFAFCLGGNITALLSISLGGVGRHFIVVMLTTPEKIWPYEKILFTIPIQYFVACCLSRLAILVFYTRIFVTRFSRLASFGLMVFLVLQAIALVATAFAECVPLDALWTDKPGKCFSVPLFYRYATFPNVIGDVLMLLLPLPVVWSLQSSIKIKVGLSITLLTGSIGLVASIARTVAFFTHNPVEDSTWASVLFTSWAVVETSCYLIAACLICLRPVLKMAADKAHKIGFPSVDSFFSYSSKFSLPTVQSRNVVITRDIRLSVAPKAKVNLGLG